QVFGFGNDGWLTVMKNQFSGRPIAGLGDPDCLAGFLMMVWPLALALWMRAGSKITQFFWGFLFVASLAALFLTGSPGGWLGMAVGTVVFAGFLLKEQGIQGLKWFALPAILIVASFFVQPMSSNLKGFIGLPSESVEFQGQVWRGAIDMIRANPLLGVGPGVFRTAFPPHRPPYLMLHQPQRSAEVEHASNWLLEWTAETGIIGVLLLMAFWFYVLAQWWKLYKANAIPKTLAAGVFSTVAAVASDNLLDSNLYSPAILIPLLFLAAFPVALSQRFYRMEGFPIQRKEVDITRWKVYLLPLLALVMALVFQKMGDVFQRQGAELDLKKAAVSASSGKWDEALDFYTKALKLDPGNIDIPYSKGSVYLDRNQPGDLEKALADFKAVESISPDYKLLHYQMYEALLRLKRE
ncbi:MAG TPA: O-antigen ligase family protein, partial [bacterium]|nr:O-antigen ligase family protein [bacterium]